MGDDSPEFAVRNGSFCGTSVEAEPYSEYSCAFDLDSDLDLDVHDAYIARRNQGTYRAEAYSECSRASDLDFGLHLDVNDKYIARRNHGMSRNAKGDQVQLARDINAIISKTLQLAARTPINLSDFRSPVSRRILHSLRQADKLNRTNRLQETLGVIVEVTKSKDRNSVKDWKKFIGTLLQVKDHKSIQTDDSSSDCKSASDREKAQSNNRYEDVSEHLGHSRKTRKQRIATPHEPTLFHRDYDAFRKRAQRCNGHEHVREHLGRPRTDRKQKIALPPSNSSLAKSLDPYRIYSDCLFILSSISRPRTTWTRGHALLRQ